MYASRERTFKPVVRSISNGLYAGFAFMFLVPSTYIVRYDGKIERTDVTRFARMTRKGNAYRR
jgi:hypothetical protein